MNVAAKVFSEVGRTFPRLFLFGISAGAGFELFKIYFAPKGISYYKVFKKNNLHRELEKYENELRATELTLIEFAQSKGIKVNDGAE
uniref:Uncharacterized protein n=2 Tax=Bursaphelenchus xylophilus TaxID=6326 RepID=A0A1I7RZR7_BURXY